MGARERETARAPSPPAAVPALPELHARPLRPPNYLTESRALRMAVQALAQAPQSILQVIAEQTLEALDAGSAGISLMSEDGERFRSPAIAGRWKQHVGMTVPREASSCADSIDLGQPLLVPRREVHVPGVGSLQPPVVEALAVPFHVEGRAVGFLWAVLHDPARAFDLEDLRVMDSLAGFASAAQHTWSQLSRVDEARRAALNLTDDAIQARQTAESLNRELFESRRALADELADSKLLQEISAEIIHEQDVHELYGKLLDTAMSLMRADHACMHVLAADRRVSSAERELRLLAERGSLPAGVQVLTRLVADAQGHYGLALRLRSRVVISDLGRFERFSDDDRNECRQAGMGACQSTPLVSRGGTVIGMLSTHWAAPHLPSDRDLRLLDILCRLTADLIERNHAEEALRQSESELSNLFETASVGLHWVGPQGRVTRVNQAELEMLGCTQDEVLGHHVSEFHVDVADVETILERLVRGEQLREHPARLRRKDGTLIDVLINSCALFKGGEFVHTQCFTTNITALKRAEEALTDREAALSEAQRVAHVGNWTWIQSTDSSVVSDEFRRIFGLEPGEPVPELKDQVGQLYSSRSWLRLQTALRGTLRTGVGFELDVEALRKHEAIWVTTRCEAIRDELGAVVGLRGTVQDITERKQLEMELARKVEELAAQDRAKSDFLAMLSHELRNPLNAIRGWVTLLQRPDLKPENVRQGIAVIDRQSRAQAELIGDLLDVQRLNSGKVRLETAPVDLANVVHGAVEAILPSATEKGIRVSRVLPEGETVVLGDANRLQQVIWNLLSNSLKFTPAGGDIRLELRRVGPQAEIRLIDTGEGITAEALPHIFERFRQADASTSRIHGGLGLGLAIARQLVDLHGGRIHAESPGKGLGSTFVVSLLLHSEADALRRRPLAEQVGASAPRSLEGRMVLVVDDEVDAREPLRRVLEAVGAEVIAVGSVDEALQVVERQRPEVIVSDIAMPVRDGYELMRSVRSLPGERGGRTPVIALTAFASPADRDRALCAGFSAHLGKPVEATRLVQVITGLVDFPLRPRVD